MINRLKNIISKEAINYGFTSWELYYSGGKSFEVKIFRGEVAQYKNSTSSGVSFRGIFKGKMGYSFTEKLEENTLEETAMLLLKNCAENAEIIEDEDLEEIFSGNANYEKVDSYSEELNKITVEEKIRKALALEKYAYGIDKRIISVDNCILANGESEVLIHNSLGLNLKHKKNIAVCYLYARAKENDSIKVAGEVWHAKDFSEFDEKKLAKKTVDKVISSLSAKTLGSGKYPVIFSNEVARDFFASFVSVFFAENVQKGFSLLKDKLGEKIASEKLNLKDDGICHKSLGSIPFDSEGVPTKNKIIIEKGILKTYLHNLKSAKKDSIISTGNGFKAGIQGTISISCCNFYIEPSDVEIKNLYKKMNNGVLITEISGLHAGTNKISGDFSLSSSGFLIKNGEILRAVEQITCAGNFYEALNLIEEVGDDLVFDPPSSIGTIGMPSIWFKEMSISGGEK